MSRSASPPTVAAAGRSEHHVRVRTAFTQSRARIRFDWGLAGALASAGQPGTAAVVVDVLSFSTAVSVACDAGVETFPFRWRDVRASQFAEAHGAQLAAGRRDGGVSLSPASIRAWLDSPSRPGRLVLPSPNGSSICYALGEQGGGPVLAGCLRNAAAVAGWLARELTSGRLSAVTVVAAGEQWPDGALRPAVEDLWGAGAVLARLRSLLAGTAFSPAAGRSFSPEAGTAFSPEAAAAAAAFEAAEPELGRLLENCASGIELIEDGFAEDVAIAAEFDAAGIAPVLTADRFRAG